MTNNLPVISSANDHLRFYYNVGRYEDGRKSLQKFAKNTKTELSDEYLDYFESNLKSENEKSQQSSQTTYREMVYPKRKICFNDICSRLNQMKCN